jgi:hypothetical protein
MILPSSAANRRADVDERWADNACLRGNTRSSRGDKQDRQGRVARRQLGPELSRISYARLISLEEKAY